jgi:hypothetical protein
MPSVLFDIISLLLSSDKVICYCCKGNNKITEFRTILQKEMNESETKRTETNENETKRNEINEMKTI